MSKTVKKFVKVCLHSSYAVQISLQFDEYFRQKISKILISRSFEIFTKTSHLKLVGTPADTYISALCTQVVHSGKRQFPQIAVLNT